MVEWQNKHIIILAHILTSVPAQDLKEFLLKKRVKRLLFIGHPLFYVKDRPGPFYELYENGQLIEKKQYPMRKYLPLVQYCKDVILTLYWITRAGRRWDLIISLDNLNTISGLILKSIGKIKKVIYYTIDFVPKRFDNPLLNNFYHYLEKLAVKYADVTWNLTNRVTKGREKILGMDTKIYNRQIVVPIGIWFDRINRKKFEQIHQHRIVYAGGLLPHQGVQLVLDAMPLLIKEIPDIEFHIIGMGSYLGELEKKSKELGIEKYVKFLGYMEDHKDVEKALSSCALAMAMYSAELSKWSYYADPSKVKTYLATGLPVVTTSVTQIAKELEKKRCGVVVKYNKKDLADAIITLLKSKARFKQYRENAISYAKEFNWDNLLTKYIGEQL